MINVVTCCIHNYTDVDGRPCPYCESERIVRFEQYKAGRKFVPIKELKSPMTLKRYFLPVLFGILLAFSAGLAIGNMVTDTRQQDQINDLRSRIYDMEQSYDKFIELTVGGLPVKGE